MRIGINALSARLGGGLIYLRHLVRGFMNEPRGHSYVVFCTPWNRDKLELCAQSNLDIIECPIDSVAGRLWFEQLHLPRLVENMEIDVLYAPAEVAPLLGRFPVVLGIQNLNVYTPNVIGRNWLERLRLRGLRALAHLSARRACAVIFVSEWARRFIAPQLHIPRQKQWVVHHGVNPAFLRATVTAEGSAHALLEEKTKERKMILAVSNLAPHKNYEVLLKSISLLPGKLRDNVLLVVVGKALEPVYTRIRDLISELKLEENVWFVGKVPHRELGLFYRKANVFVHPSREETFGLPVLEAMASGLPIICSRAGALPEIAGEAALYFDCNDAQSLTNLITQVLSDPGSVSGKASYGLQRVQAFSWERTAEKMIQIFQACVQPSLRH